MFNELFRRFLPKISTFAAELVRLFDTRLCSSRPYEAGFVRFSFVVLPNDRNRSCEDSGNPTVCVLSLYSGGDLDRNLFYSDVC